MAFTTTTKWALRKLTGASLVNDIDAGFEALAEDIDAKLTPYDAGLLAARPTSTSGSPGKAGRTYRATDTGVIYLDTGTGWLPVGSVLPATGMTMGDVTLSRDGAGILGISGAAQATGDINARVGSATRVNIGAQGPYAGIAFGSMLDTSLYRDNPGVLRTDGTFKIGSLDAGLAIAALQAPEAAVVRRISTSLNIPDGVITAVTYPTETLDRPGTQFNPASPNVLTCRRAGTYTVTARVLWAPNATGHRELRLVWNGNNDLMDSRNAVTTSGHGTAQSTSRTYQLTAGQTIEVQVYQTSGGALSIGDAELTWTRIGD
jgi:hypothetical protein